MLVTDQIRSNFPFPELLTEPTKLALKLQERIKYMFGITVEPVIDRQSASYYKTIAFRHLWSMKTKCGKYCIASYECASEMGKKSAWHVLDYPLFDQPQNDIKTKFIF